jgi:RimJ/RimL family protein N-acetyltransferase
MNEPSVAEQPYFLRTKRLGFRVWREDDLPLALALWGDPEVMRFIDSRGQLSAEEVKGLLRNHITTEREHSVQYWPIFLLADGQHVGCCGLRPYNLPQRIYELGVHLRCSQWGYGLAQEATSTVIDYAFSKVGAASLFAGHNPNNTASKRLLERLGFRFTHLEFYPATGLQHPSYILEQIGHAKPKTDQRQTGMGDGL